MSPSFPPASQFICLNPHLWYDGTKSWAFVGWQGHDDGALRNGITAIVSGCPTGLPAPPALWRHSEKLASAALRPLPEPSNTGNKSLFFKPHSPWYLVTAARMDYWTKTIHTDPFSVSICQNRKQSIKGAWKFFLLVSGIYCFFN